MSGMSDAKPKAVDLDLSGAEWKRSSADATGEGLEIAFVGEYILMRSAATPDGPVLVFDQAEWDAFVAGAKDGEFDLNENGEFVMPYPPAGTATT